MNVLQALCRRSSFDEPSVKITKPQLCELINGERKSVQRGLQFLVSEGSVKCIKNQKGGRGVCPTYQLIVIPLAAGEIEDEPKEKTPALRSELVRQAVDRILSDNRGMSYGEARGMAEDEIA
jgi:hypothetical protein